MKRLLSYRLDSCGTNCENCKALRHSTWANGPIGSRFKRLLNGVENRPDEFEIGLSNPFFSPIVLSFQFQWSNRPGIKLTAEQLVNSTTISHMNIPYLIRLPLSLCSDRDNLHCLDYHRLIFYTCEVKKLSRFMTRSWLIKHVAYLMACFPFHYF